MTITINDNLSVEVKEYVDDGINNIRNNMSLPNVLLTGNTAINQHINLKIEEGMEAYKVQNHDAETVISLGRNAAGNGVINMKSPNGTLYKVSIADDGTLTTTLA